jgi:hypothetical protein
MPDAQQLVQRADLYEHDLYFHQHPGGSLARRHPLQRSLVVDRMTFDAQASHVISHQARDANQFSTPRSPTSRQGTAKTATFATIPDRDRKLDTTRGHEELQSIMASLLICNCRSSLLHIRLPMRKYGR